MDFLELKSGTTVEGDKIQAFKSELKSPAYHYLMAGVHGDEVEGVYLLKKFFEWLKEEDESELLIPIIVIPILNIDGYRTGTRTNAHGVDLNRNLPAKSWAKSEGDKKNKKYHPGDQPLSEPENQFLNKLFQKWPPKFILTFHSWRPMLNFNGDCLEQANFLKQHNSYPVCDMIENHPTPGSLGQYSVEKYNCPVLTFECPLINDNLTLENIWEENQKALKEFAKLHLN